jgi:hypothetical protein
MTQTHPLFTPKGVITTQTALAAAICLAACAVGPVLGAQKTGAKADSETNVTTLPTSAPSPVPPRAIEYVVVVGFRIRPTAMEQRLEAINAGYRELTGKNECEMRLCGYVVVPEDGRWRTTNVLAGTETELRERQAILEREGATLVVVHPNGVRRQVPVIHVATGQTEAKPADTPRSRRRPR